jgi:hypothetical protein
MNIEILALPAPCGKLLHLAIVPGKPDPNVLTVLGKARPLGKVMSIQPGAVIGYVDVDLACNELHERGWTVFGSGFVPK